MSKKYSKWAEVAVLVVFFGGYPMLYRLGQLYPPRVKGAIRREK